MSDFLLHQRPDGNFDLSFDAKLHDLELSEGLGNAVAISIGSYARERTLGSAANLKAPIGGWFGDALDENGTLGGYLYEAFPGKLADSTCRKLEVLVLEALEWLKRDGVARNVSAHAKISGEDAETVTLEVVVERPENSESFKFEINWRAAADGI